MSGTHCVLKKNNADAVVAFTWAFPIIIILIIF